MCSCNCNCQQKDEKPVVSVAEKKSYLCQQCNTFKNVPSGGGPAGMLRQENAGDGLTRRPKPDAALPGGVRSWRRNAGGERGFPGPIPGSLKPVATESFRSDGRDDKL